MKQYSSPPNNSDGMFPVSFPYRFRINPVSFSYRSPIVLLLGNGKQYGNDTEWNEG